MISFSANSSTAFRVSGLTSHLSAKARDTVDVEILSSRARSLIVIRDLDMVYSFRMRTKIIKNLFLPHFRMTNYSGFFRERYRERCR